MGEAAGRRELPPAPIRRPRETDGRAGADVPSQIARRLTPLAARRRRCDAEPPASHLIIGESHMKRVTGIGGVFFKAKDAPALQAWYKRHLGIDVQAWG